MAKLCFNCGAQCADMAPFCDKCGASLAQAGGNYPPPTYGGGSPPYGGGPAPYGDVPQQPYQQPPYSAPPYGNAPQQYGYQPSPYGDVSQSGYPPPPKKKKKLLPLIIILCVLVVAGATIGIMVAKGVIATLGNTAKLDYIKLGNDEIPTVKNILRGERNMTGMSTSTSGGAVTKTLTYSVPIDSDKDMREYARGLMENYGYYNTTPYDFSERRGVGFEFARESSEAGFILVVRIDYDSGGYTITMTRSRGTLTVYDDGRNDNGGDDRGGNESGDGEEAAPSTPTPRPPTPAPDPSPEATGFAPAPTPEPLNPDPTSGDDGLTLGVVIPGGGGDVRIDGETGCTFVPNQSGMWEFRTYGSGSSDPYIAVMDSRGDFIVQDDDGGGGYDALCSANLNAGESYTVYVFFWEGPSYSTTLSTTFTGGGAPTAPADPGGSGTLPGRGGSTQVNGGGGIQFTPEITGIWVIYTSNNGSSDPILELRDSNANLLSEDDDGWGDLNSLLTVILIAGERYTILIDFFGGGPGSCTLNAKPPEVINASGGSVPVNNTAGFIFTPTQSGTYELRTANNGNYDPYMYVYDPNGYVGDNDDDGGNMNAVLTLNLTAGVYYHILIGFWDASGSLTGVGNCTLEVTRR